MQSQEVPGTGKNMGRIVLIMVVVVLVVSLSALGYAVYHGALASANKSSEEEVASGDLVKLNYIGMLPDGRVFDTSLLDVAHNDIQYPKSLTFTLRANDTYKPFEMTAGNYGQGGTIKGFANGVIGMSVNETKLIEVPPDEGYPVDPSMLKTVDIFQKIPATESFSESDFLQYFSAQPILMSTLTHFFWGWQVMVVDNSSGVVTVKHQPTVGEVVYPYGDPSNSDDPNGWPVVIEAYDPSGLQGAGLITIRHQISAEDVYNIKGIDSDGLTFVLSAYDSAAGTFQISKSNPDTGYNGELAGRTLYFQVTITKITKF